MKIDSPTFLTETTFISASVQFSSGSQKFGDSNDDTHQFTGSLSISGSIGIKSDSRNNLFIGQNAGTGSGIGQFNTAIGIDALTSPRGAESIVAIGRDAGKNITKSSQSGVYSVLVGQAANYNNTAGSQNIAIGYYAGGHSSAGQTNAIMIGFQAAAAGPGPTNSTVIGTSVFGGDMHVSGTLNYEDYMIISVSADNTDLATGAGQASFRAPFPMSLPRVPRASLTTAGTGASTVDIHVAGTTIMNTNKLTFDANESTTTTAATAAALTTTTIADDALITIDVDTAGAGARGLKVTLYYRRTG